MHLVRWFGYFPRLRPLLRSIYCLPKKNTKWKIRPSLFYVRAHQNKFSRTATVIYSWLEDGSCTYSTMCKLIITTIYIKEKKKYFNVDIFIYIYCIYICNHYWLLCLSWIWICFQHFIVALFSKGIVLYSVVLYSVAWYCIPRHCIPKTFYRIPLYCIPLHCIVFQGIVFQKVLPWKAKEFTPKDFVWVGVICSAFCYIDHIAIPSARGWREKSER